MDRAEREAARLALGKDAVLSVAAAVALLPFGDAKSRRWLEARGLVRNKPELGKYVLWGEVLTALSQEEAPQQPRPTPQLPRKRLR